MFASIIKTEVEYSLVVYWLVPQPSVSEVVVSNPGSHFPQLMSCILTNTHFFLSRQCTVVGKGEINYFSILDFMASEQSLEDIWKLGGQNFEK